MSIKYEGQKHCRLVHGPSGSVIETDAPVDNGGHGQKFSPTDLLAASLGSCILTTLAIIAEKEALPLNFQNSEADVDKEMVANPRRVGALHIHLRLPKSIPLQYHDRLQQIAETCPVSLSLSPEVKVHLKIEYCL